MIYRLRSRHSDCNTCEKLISELNRLDNTIEETRQTLEKAEQQRRTFKAILEEHTNNA